MVSLRLWVHGVPRIARRVQHVPRTFQSAGRYGDIVERQHWVDTTAVRRAASRLPGRELRREQIIEAALSAIEENGPHALTGQIADKAGLGRTHFYRHFASKEELDLAVARHVHRELTAKIRLTLDVRDRR